MERGEWRGEGKRWRGESGGEKVRDGEGRVEERRKEMERGEWRGEGKR